LGGSPLYFRDLDGCRRLVTRYGQTRAQAERRLREALRDRGTSATLPVQADSRVSGMAALWLAAIDTVTWHPGTKRLYRFVTDSYVLPALGELCLREVTDPAMGVPPLRLTRSVGGQRTSTNTGDCNEKCNRSTGGSA
jgi:hypothetical protein